MWRQLTGCVAWAALSPALPGYSTLSRMLKSFRHTSPMRKSLKNRWLGGLLMLLSSYAWSATATPEYQLKAVFLFNFTQFVEWPSQAFTDANAPLVMGVLGTDPFGSYLDDTVRGETINGRPLTVQRYNSADEIKNCNILFISRSEAARLPQIFASLKGRNILTVGDTDNFNREGGIIRFATVANKIRLRIGLEAAKAANLTISSKLLRPADIVGPGEE
ncbi:MAG: YfiR family protein [Steroidobacteraceae bacterium]